MTSAKRKYQGYFKPQKLFTIYWKTETPNHPWGTPQSIHTDSERLS